MLLTKFWVSPLLLWLLFSEVASFSNVEAKDYYIQVKTGNRSLAGTDANTYLTIYGSEGTTAETRLNGLISGDAFERNSLDSLTLVDLADVGSLQSVSIRSDGSWFGADWYLSWVMVDDKQATFNRWIEGAKSATADLYTVTLVPTLSPTTSPSPSEPNSSSSAIVDIGRFLVVLGMTATGIFILATASATGICVAQKYGCGPYSSDKSNDRGGSTREFNTTIIATPIAIPVEFPRDSFIAAEMNTSNSHSQVLH